ncbi:MAG: hypothetical protein R2838_04705 [Caldilineaceae bacterium]
MAIFSCWASATAWSCRRLRRRTSFFHYGFAHYVAETGRLPVQDPAATGPWAQEGSQAPLYYLLTGWLTRHRPE